MIDTRRPTTSTTSTATTRVNRFAGLHRVGFWEIVKRIGAVSAIVMIPLLWLAGERHADALNAQANTAINLTKGNSKQANAAINAGFDPFGGLFGAINNGWHTLTDPITSIGMVIFLLVVLLIGTTTALIVMARNNRRSRVTR